MLLHQIEHQICHLRLQTEHHQDLQVHTAEEIVAQAAVEVMVVEVQVVLAVEAEAVAEEDNLFIYNQAINISY
jgi:hypothetical protein